MACPSQDLWTSSLCLKTWLQKHTKNWNVNLLLLSSYLLNIKKKIWLWCTVLFSRFVVDFIHTEGPFLVLYILLVKLEIELKGRCFLFSSVPFVIKDEPSHSRYKVMEWCIFYLNNTEKQHNTASHETHSLPRGNWGHETHMSLFFAPTISLLKAPDNSAFLPFSIPGGAIWYLAIS